MNQLYSESSLKKDDGFFGATFFLYWIYKILLDVSYATILVPMYGYAGFALQYTPKTVFFGLLMSAAAFLCVPKRLEAVSDFVFMGLAALAVVPCISYYALGGGSFSYTLMTFFMFLGILALVKFTPSFSFPSLTYRQADIVFAAILWATAVFVIMKCIMAVGVSGLSLDFSTIYQRRAAYKASGAAGGYLITWAGNVIFPCSIAYFLQRKKYMHVCAAVGSSVFLFSVSGMKTVLFGSVMVVGVYVLFKMQRKMRILLLILVGIVFLTMLAFYITGSPVLYSYVVRRLCFLTAKVSNEHFEFFLQNGPIRMGNSILSSVVIYPYESDPADIIGSLHYIAGETHANSGFFADAFTNFGYFGGFLWTVIFAFLMKLQDMVSQNKPFYVTCACFALFLTIFTNSALFTSIMTHGFLAATVLVAMIPKTEHQKSEKGE